MASNDICLAAIIMVCGHNVFPHHQHDENLAIEQHHDHDHDAGFFKTGHVDDAFVPSHTHYDFHCDASLVLFTLSSIELDFELTYISNNTEYSLNKQFPPPAN